MRFGLKAESDNYAVSWLAMVAHHPWIGVPVMFALVDHDNHLHPWAMAAMVHPETGDELVDPDQLGQFIDRFPFHELPAPESAIMAVGIMRETYIGELDGMYVVKTKAENRIGDRPEDAAIRRCIVTFAGGGKQTAVAVRDENTIGVNDAIRDDFEPGLVDQLQRVMAVLNTGVLPE